jgi:hypothetical protein
LRNVSGIACAVGTASDQRVTGANIATIGELSVVASATPSCMLIVPGPRVAVTTAARPVTWPYLPAMDAAACSGRVSMYPMFDAANF